MNNSIYILFLIPIKDFFATLNKKEFSFLFIIPFIFTAVLNLFIFYEVDLKDLFQNLGNIINLLAILIGFSITGLAILASGGSENLNLLRKTNSREKKLDGKPVDLYKLLLNNFTYAVILELFTLGFNLLFSFIYSATLFKNSVSIFYTIDCFLIIHIILLNIKNVTNIYFSLFKEVEK